MPGSPVARYRSKSSLSPSTLYTGSVSKRKASCSKESKKSRHASPSKRTDSLLQYTHRNFHDSLTIRDLFFNDVTLDGKRAPIRGEDGRTIAHPAISTGYLRELHDSSSPYHVDSWLERYAIPNYASRTMRVVA